MVSPTTLNAGCKKIRCPKCTALFLAPVKTVFKCPICACSLSAVASSFHPIVRGKCGQTDVAAAVENSKKDIKEQDTADSKDGTLIQTDTCMHHQGAKVGTSLTLVQNLDQLLKNEIKEGFELHESDLYKHESASIDGAADNIYKNVHATETSSGFSDYNFGIIKKETAEHGFAEKGGVHFNKGHLQESQAAGCELSFRYSLIGSLPLQSDKTLSKLIRSEVSSSDITSSNTDASDVSSHAPFRIRKLNTQEENSRQTDDDSYSFNSDVESGEGSEADFNFLSPWADDHQDKIQSDSGKSGLIQDHLEQAVIESSHQLQLLEIVEGPTSKQKVIAIIEKEEESDGCMETSAFNHSSQTIDLGKRTSFASIHENCDLEEDISRQGLECSRKKLDIVPDIGEEVNSKLNSDVDKNDQKICSKNGKSSSQFCIEDKNLSLNISNSDKPPRYGDAQNSYVFMDVTSFPSLNNCNMSVATSRDIPSRKHDVLGSPSRHDNIPAKKTQKGPDITQSVFNSGGLGLEDASARVIVLETIKHDHPPVPRSCTTSHLISNSSRDLNVCVELGTKDKSMPDTEMEDDLYNYYVINEWQYMNEKSAPCKSNHQDSMQSSYHSNPYQIRGESRLFSDYIPKKDLDTRSQPIVFTGHCVSNHCNVKPVNCNHMCSHPVPSPPLIMPCALQNHSMSSVGSHILHSACMPVCQHQQQLLQTHACHSCAVHLSHSGPVCSNFRYADNLRCQRCNVPVHTSPNSLMGCSQAPTNVLQVRQTLCKTDTRLHAAYTKKASQLAPLPRAGAYPYYACKECSNILEVPLNLSPTVVVKKLRCSVCGRISKFSDKVHVKQRRLASELSSRELFSNFETGDLRIQYDISHDDKVLKPTSSQNSEEVSDQVCSVFDVGSALSFKRSEVSCGEPDHLRGKLGGTTNGRCLSCSENSRSITDVMSKMGKELGPVGNVRVQRKNQDVGASLHGSVKEQNKELMFGAPIISDGESLNQIEGRNHSQENIQIQTLGQITVLDNRKQNPGNRGKSPGSPLIILLNQGSTRFMINSGSSKHSGSAGWASASDALALDCRGRRRCPTKKLNNLQFRSSLMRIGPKCVARLFRRNLRDTCESRAVKSSAFRM
ncbi:hypothetical protein KP509_11G076400 [Ceratopteris richardii]|uniref:Zinc-ribbon domain-containing protein n=1 Tax=Ceratopteris richardii TaxID=49495 RepID=A0A8T2TR79_CERRI|nr:hypothetical protein KP509_11G076400 [Ceratopteris richardii]